MKAVMLYGNGVSKVADIPIPTRGDGEILLKVMSSAVCGSEMPNYRSDLKESMPNGGHEMSGEVVDAGESKVFRNGDRVVAQIMNGCNECYYCKNGTLQFCPSLRYVGGTHAQYVSFPENCVIKAPNDIDYDMLVLLGGDVVGVANRAAKQLDIKKGQTVFISGAGPIGLGMAAMMKRLGCRLIVSEPSAFRREYVKKHTGAEVVLNPSKGCIKDELYNLTEGIGPEITIECSGNPKAQLEALEFTRCGGTVMFCGENYNTFEIVPSNHIIHKELTVKGAFYFTADDFTEIVEMYRNGFDVSALVSHRVPIDEAPEIIAQFAAGNTGKVLIHPQE